MRRIALAALALIFGAGAAHGAEAALKCLPTGSATITVRIGAGPPAAARLEGGIETPLSLFHAASGHLLWSAAAHPAAIQQVPALDAPIFGSLTALDLDGDGVHDRIYAGDSAGRLWRFDLQHGAAAAEWAKGGVFADFQNTEGRGFLAPPDVSLSAPPGAASWLNIVAGTAAPGNPAANNRLYVLRDHAVFAEIEEEPGRPVREGDLQRVRTLQGEIASTTQPDPQGPGWYVELGRGHVIAPTLTVEHRAVVVIAAAVPRDGGSCEVFARTAELDLLEAQVVPAAEGGDWSAPLAKPVHAAARLEIGNVQGGIAACTLAGERIPACDVDTRPRRTWWRRADAE